MGLSGKDKILMVDLALMLTQLHSDILSVMIATADDNTDLKRVNKSIKEMDYLVKKFSEDVVEE